MFFSRKTSRPGSADLEYEALYSKIAHYHTFIEEAPRRIREQMDRERNTIPAPDDLKERRRRHQFNAQLSRNQIRNERKFRSRNTALFVLLTAATSSVTWWIYAELVINGVLK